MIKKWQKFILILLLGGLTMCFLFGCKKKEITFTQECQLLYKPIWEKDPENRIVEIIKKGTKAKVLGVEYSKDYKYYEIKTENENQGYIILGLGNFIEN
jgi:hypothetical protein